MNYTIDLQKTDTMFAFEVLTLHQNILLNSAIVVEEIATNHIFIMVED